MNKRLTIIIIACVVAVGAVAVVMNLASYQPVTFTVKQDGVNSLTVYGPASNHKAGTLSGSGQLKLKNGSYTVVPGGQKTSTDAIAFKVNGPTTVTVAPGYSKLYLAQILASQQATIDSLIKSTYPIINTGFKLGQGRLYLDGSWYGTTIPQNSPGRGENGDVYRTVLHKTGDKWTIVARPAIVLSAKNYPNVPHSILDDLNKQTGY